MRDNEIEVKVVSVMIKSVKQFNNEELCAMNLALNLYSRIDSVNVAYNKAVRHHLIHPDGTPYEIDYLKKACAVVINDRKNNNQL